MDSLEKLIATVLQLKIYTEIERRLVEWRYMPCVACITSNNSFIITVFPKNTIFDPKIREEAFVMWHIIRVQLYSYVQYNSMLISHNCWSLTKWSPLKPIQSSLQFTWIDIIIICNSLNLCLFQRIIQYYVSISMNNL